MAGNDRIDIAQDDGRISVVTTIFPQYDFVRQIAGDSVDLKMLLKPGEETHSYEPTPQDIIAIQNSDIFIYVGGESDAWVADVLASVGEGVRTVTLMDCVETVAEEEVEGMETHGHAHDHEEVYTGEQDDPDPTEETDHEHAEQDEHVWTSPRNAVLIVEKLRDALIAIDPENAGDYTQNAADYIAKLEQLDQEFQDVTDSAERNTIILGDRFPFRYLADAYGLDYYAAFPGCSSESEASAKTVAFLIDKVKEEQIPVVFSIELSNEKMTDSICEATDAKKLQLHSCHNVTKDDFEQGVTYLDLMERNVQALKEALN